MSGTPVNSCSCGAVWTGTGGHTCMPGRPGPVQVTPKPKGKS